MFMVGVLLFTIASLGCGPASSPAALVSARAAQGTGAAIMTPTALSPSSASSAIVRTGSTTRRIGAYTSG
jgi:MFS family permease